MWKESLAKGAQEHGDRGLVSPLVGFVWNYQGGLWRAGIDVHDLLLALPNLAVHVCFLSAIGVSLAALFSLRKRWTPEANQRRVEAP